MGASCVTDVLSKLVNNSPNNGHRAKLTRWASAAKFQ